MKTSINRKREKLSWVAPSAFLDIPIGFRIYQTIIFALVAVGFIVGLIGV
jgi:hypothetical protein|tara:strand:+ start:121 stop:270 length:150 start_codon:yes stop_codon:yes gene_type:complete